MFTNNFWENSIKNIRILFYKWEFFISVNFTSFNVRKLQKSGSKIRRKRKNLEKRQILMFWMKCTRRINFLKALNSFVACCSCCYISKPYCCFLHVSIVAKSLNIDVVACCYFSSYCCRNVANCCILLTACCLICCMLLLFMNLQILLLIVNVDICCWIFKFWCFCMFLLFVLFLQCLRTFFALLLWLNLLHILNLKYYCLFCKHCIYLCIYGTISCHISVCGCCSFYCYLYCHCCYNFTFFNFCCLIALLNMSQ